jgi:two-component system, chemotaxis family, sensor kinase CheA
MNSQDNRALYVSFLADGANYLQNLNSLLLRLEQEPKSTKLRTQAFRNAHSLKSEASYLNETEIAKAAHELESRLEELESGSSILDKKAFDFLFSHLDRIQEMFTLRKDQSGFEAETEETEEKEATGEEPNDETGGKTAQPEGEGVFDFIPDFSDFERELLHEARERGERFLRITVYLEEDTPISYAKGYLILNNLEQLLQVVRTNPPFGSGHEEQANEAKYRSISFFCTGSAEDAKIYRAVNVDQVERILLSPLSFESVLYRQVGKTEWERSSGEISLRISAGDLDSLNGYIDELKIRIHRLSRHVPKEKEQIDSLRQLVDGLEDFAARLSMVDLGKVFLPHFRMVRDLAAKLDKHAELTLEGSGIRVDRRAAEILSEIVVHLIRNALDHGIERPDERLSKGKAEAGLILIKARQEEGKLYVSVGDDGRGIQKDLLLERAKRQGIRIDELPEGEEDLIRFLVYPGLTTLNDATETSGRGYGLDLVFQKIRRFEGGGLSVESDVEGTTFTIEMPAGFTLMTLQIVRCGGRFIAVPARHIRSTVKTEEGVFSADENGALLWNSLPVFTLEGRLYRTDVSPSDSTGLVLSYLDKEAVLLVDELMFKKEIPEDRLTLYIEGSPYLHKMKISGSGTEFTYLSPSIVTI